MTGPSILSQFQGRVRALQAVFANQPRPQPSLHQFWRQPDRLPGVTKQTPAAMRTLELLGPLDWDHFPERDLQRKWRQPAISYAAFSAAMLVKLNEGLKTMGDLRRYLVEQPGFIPLLGFRVTRAHRQPWGFDPQASLPTQRHLTRMLRELPNAALQFLLADSVRLLRQELARHNLPVGACISLDTKHILAWVKENNPKAFVEERFDKTKQPAGDPDCKLGCKRQHNQRKKQAVVSNAPATPTTNPQSAEFIKVGEYYWGYGSGVVVTKVPGWGEIVLAELTQTFDQADVSYFFPLMAQTEQVLGFKPQIGTFDAAFDAWYVYDYFHRPADPQAFAAVPFSEKGGYKAHGRQFSPEGLPICQANLAMPLHFTYRDTTVSLIPHERGKYVCPLRFPAQTATACPVNHKNWAKKGCTAMLPTSIGARLRYTLDRESPAYKAAFKQRTAVERINSQAKALGIERPLLRNGRAIANLNTLIYILINLRLLQRIRNNQPAPD